MSSSDGRSWRPAKKITARDSRKVQIILVGALLTSLIAAIAFLILRPGVPPLHFVVVSEHGFESDSTALTPMSTGATAFNAKRLEELASRFERQQPQRVSKSETHKSIAEFVSGKSVSTGESLIIYVGAEAWCVWDKDHPDETFVELLPASPAKQPIRFSEVLQNIQKRNSAQTVLLLEVSGRHSGLASGAIADDVPAQIRREVERAKISGLTVICACKEGERTWEYYSDDNGTYTVAPVGTEPNATSLKQKSSLPQFEGTAFGYFICQALEEGKAGSAAELYETLKSEVQPWVAGHFGENQTVWMVSADVKWTRQELLKRARVQKEPLSGPPLASAVEVKDETGSSAVGDKVSAAGKPSTETQVDETPVFRLAKLRVRQKALADQTMAPVLYPGDWLRLEINFAGAERLAMNVDQDEFNSLHDNVLLRMLNDLERKTTVESASSERQALREWILPAEAVGVSQEDGRLLKKILADMSAEPAKALEVRLPDEFEERPELRRAVVTTFLKDLKDLSESIADKPVAERSRLILRQIHLAQNLSSRWPQKVLPESIAAIREVLHGSDEVWLANVLKPLVRLIELRQQALLLAVGYGAEGRMLRRVPWTQGNKDIELVLKELHAAERWLSVGPDGVMLAEDRLMQAKQQLARLKEQAEVSERIASIKDAQLFEIPYLIQYFSLRLDDTPLLEQDRNTVKSLTDPAKAADFPIRLLKPAGLTWRHIEAMFALTRDFSESEVTEADQSHYLFLKKDISERSEGPVTTIDGRDLFTIRQDGDR